MAEKAGDSIENDVQGITFSQDRITIPLNKNDDSIVVGSNVKLCVGELQSGMKGGMEINGQVIQHYDDKIVIEPSNPDIAKTLPQITATGNYEVRVVDGDRDDACSRNLLKNGVFVKGRELGKMLDMVQPSLDAILDDFKVLDALNYEDICKIISFLEYKPKNLTEYELQMFSGIASARLQNVKQRLQSIHDEYEYETSTNIPLRKELEKNLKRV